MTVELERITKRRREALELAVYQIRRSHGAGAIYRLGDRSARPARGWSTGSLALDLALGGVGIPRGRVAEVFGPEGSGKTTLALHAIAACQRDGGTAAFVDVEHALDLGYAQQVGVAVGDLLFSQPGSGDEALGIVDLLARGGGVDLVVVDSVAALQPRDELALGLDNGSPGNLARLVSQALRRLVPAADRGQTTLLFINQLRHQIRGHGLPARETTPGGWALRFFSAVRVDVRRVQAIKEANTVIGSRTRARVVKNKVAPPFGVAEFAVLFGGGIDRGADLLECGRTLGVVTGRGTLEFAGRWLGVPTAAAQVVAGDPALAGALEVAVREQWARYRA